MTKADFFREEQRALQPWQPGLFDGLADGAIQPPFGAEIERVQTRQPRFCCYCTGMGAISYIFPGRCKKRCPSACWFLHLGR